MFINEAFISYVWQFQYFEKNGLEDSTGETVSVISPGNKNSDQGPDFSNAVIRIGDVTWHGNIEIHIKSSHWIEHNHLNDPMYDSVVLHVVWENDVPIARSDASSIPALELNGRISNNLIYKFHNLIESRNPLPCSPDICRIDNIYLKSMMEKVLVERLQEKSRFAIDTLKICNNDWEETTYRVLLRNFGFKINQHPMLGLASYLPFKLIKKHSDNLVQIEALLFGTAGFLKEKAIDEYHLKLKNEYGFLSKKYNVTNGFLSRYQWKFMRTHPANFPTVRIAQLGSFLYGRTGLFNLITSTYSVKEITGMFDNLKNSYWINHYDFGKKSPRKNSLGKSSIHGLIINTCMPILGAYSLQMDDPGFNERAINLLSQIPAEDNKITRMWESLGVIINNAGDSQALIHLSNNYCIKKNCLNCMVGMKLLNTDGMALDF
jgi:hypothetical protein